MDWDVLAETVRGSNLKSTVVMVTEPEEPALVVGAVVPGEPPPPPPHAALAVTTRPMSSAKTLLCTRLSISGRVDVRGRRAYLVPKGGRRCSRFPRRSNTACGR